MLLLICVTSFLERERYSGTTATVCLLVDNVHLHTASVGDSRALLGRREGVVALTSDHSPNREDERERVESDGGTIISNSLGEPQVPISLQLLQLPQLLQSVFRAPL